MGATGWVCEASRRYLMCERKARFLSKNQAKWRARQFAGPPQRAYECPYCRMWHLTSQEVAR